VGASSVSAIEKVEVGIPVAEEGAASASAASSSRTSSSLSELLRMMTLPSPGSLRTSWLRSPKSLLMNSSSHEVSGMRPYSFEDKERSSTGAFLEEFPCSNTGECGLRKETSGGDSSGGGDPEGADGGVGASLSTGLPSLEGEQVRLVPLLSSIVHE
jgi:hypothetical protein